MDRLPSPSHSHSKSPTHSKTPSQSKIRPHSHSHSNPQTPSSINERPNRLPTLAEILGKRTAPPVDLFNFYIFMRDREQSEDILDFWLDIKQHENLCAAYANELHRAGLLDDATDSAYMPMTWSRYSRMSDRFSTVRSRENAATITSIRTRSPIYDKDLKETSSLDQVLIEELQAHKFPRHSDEHAEILSEKSSLPPSPSPPPVASGSPIAEHHDDDDAITTRPYHRSLFHEKFKDTSTSDGDKHSPRSIPSPIKRLKRPPTLDDIRLSSDRIYYQFLVPGSEKDIVALLPHHVVAAIRQNVEVEHRDDPVIYTEAKEYMFRLMEQEAYPKFLQAKALENLTPLGALLRLIIGLFALFCAFTTSLSLIFLDIKPRSVRIWALIPFIVSSWLLLSHQWMLDPVMAMPPLNLSEATPFRHMKVREPFVRTLLHRQAIKVGVLALLLTAFWMAIFLSVPGKRL